VKWMSEIVESNTHKAQIICSLGVSCSSLIRKAKRPRFLYSNQYLWVIR
jgi:hypothetical protein